MNACSQVSVRSRVRIPLASGSIATIVSFNGFDRSSEHFILHFEGRKPTAGPTLARVHSECITGDLFGSLRCDCGKQLAESVSLLSEHGGILAYLRQEGRGIGLYSKLDAYLLQDEGFDTFEANNLLHLPSDARTFACAGKMMKAMEITSIALITNNPEKAIQLRAQGIDVRSTKKTGAFVNKHNEGYLRAKVEKANHAISLPRAACSANAAALFNAGFVDSIPHLLAGDAS